ncbi:MAG: bifunctional diaminohydroxyphosphoribosylaminopyrimidine deaminase/5-amino-6-(5-phosphoribosylamino)uracil reductase RibD [Nitrospiraceae bacterium]|nr:MAG: bifunctional diaminohydroxyphosphoribosylaminopyrimidine deaminase/5-amino-6-(5-phosphoribosylamino)uracil reductase RibD [Nitrospiraceae bacterium]
MDEYYKTFMERALALAAKGKGRTSPNPMVGAVIVKGNKVIAEGFHKKAGTAHAEIIALKKAGTKARGSTLFLNLEPCCHTDKKTPPCTKTIIQSGIKKVVASMTDPNPKVSGRGFKELKKAGLDIEVGLMEAEAKKLNESFIKYIRTKKPFVILKMAQSLDGKIATARGESQWITGKEARKYVHRMRNELDAVLVGIGTVLKDNPSLDCRMSKGRNPYRVIVDSRLQISQHAKVFKHRDNKTIIATTQKASTRKVNMLRKHAQILFIDEKAGKTHSLRKKESSNISNGVNLKSLMRELGKLGITSVMIEGGSALAASALSDRIVDKLMFFIAPKIIGGRNSIPSVGGESPALLRHAVSLRDFQAISVGKDLLVECYPLY